jgi:hypothetical protein
VQGIPPRVLCVTVIEKTPREDLNLWAAVEWREEKTWSHLTGMLERSVCCKTTVSFRETEETEGKMGGRSSVGYRRLKRCSIVWTGYQHRLVSAGQRSVLLFLEERHVLLDIYTATCCWNWKQTAILQSRCCLLGCVNLSIESASTKGRAAGREALQLDRHSCCRRR